MSGPAGAIGMAARPPAGAILAGGSARRLGGLAKGLELLAGSRIVDRVVTALGEVTDEIILVGAPPAVAAALPQLRPIADEAPGAGPLGAIVTALHATGRDTIIVAWDMPFLTPQQLRPLLAAPNDAEAVIWEVEARMEPLCGLYRASAAGPLAEAFAEGERSPQEALRRLRVHLVRHPACGDPRTFTSVNTPEQLTAARDVRAGGSH